MNHTETVPTSPSPWLRPYAAAAYLGVALGTLRNWTSTGHVPFARRGRVVRYHREELDAWLRQASNQRQQNPPDNQRPAPAAADDPRQASEDDQ